MIKYDYLLVGAGLFSATLAVMFREAGKKCLVAEKRNHIAGNIYTENIEGIQIHKYGAHIFHTDSEKCWNFINRFADFNRYTNSPMAYINGKLYNLPFNMNTFNKIWEDVITPEQAQKRIAEQNLCRTEKAFHSTSGQGFRSKPVQKFWERSGHPGRLKTCFR